MVKIQFYPLDMGYRLIDGKLAMQLYGRTKDGRQICVQDTHFPPYLYVLPKKSGAEDTAAKLEGLSIEKNESKITVSKAEVISKKYMGKEVSLVRLSTMYPRDIPTIRNALAADYEVFESDILYVRRYLIDKAIEPLVLTEAEGEFTNQRSKVSVFQAESIQQSSTDSMAEQRVLALDIETYNPEGKGMNAEKNPILMASLYGDSLKKVIVTKRFADPHGYIEFAQSEAELIRRVQEIIEEYKPDIIAGYFSDGFDMPYLARRSEKLGVKFELGLDYTPIQIDRKGEMDAKVEGIPHIDIYQFIRRAFSTALETPTFDLNSVAKELIGTTKMSIDISLLADVYDNHPEKLKQYCEYNLRDAELTHTLTTSLLPNIIELSKLVSVPLFAACRMSFSQLVEWYLIKRSFELGELVPNKPEHGEARKRMLDTFQGAFVYKPTPGLFKDIVVFDFRSLYPSIITSHNISPETLDCDCCPTQGKVPGEPYRFCTKKKGFISTVIGDLITRRMRVKEIVKAKGDSKILFARQYALKTIANAMYGYLGFFMARWYCLPCVKSITSYGRNYIQTVITKAEKAGFRILYGDTDSIFLALEGKKREDATLFLEEINRTLPDLMELDLDGYYPRGLFVSVKMGATGAKKRYALLREDGKIKITGFEMVRRNISEIAKGVQEEVLNIILKENNTKKALDHVRDAISRLRKREVPKEQVIIYTQLKKGIDEYSSIGPHVAVAKRLKEKGYDVNPGSMIQYIICTGSGLIRDRARLPEECAPGEYDPEYYINNQIIPAVEKIFEVLGYTKESLQSTIEQKKLDKFF